MRVIRNILDWNVDCPWLLCWNEAYHIFLDSVSQYEHRSTSIWGPTYLATRHEERESLLAWWDTLWKYAVWSARTCMARGPISQRVYELLIEILGKCFFLISIPLILSCHDFAYVTTAELSWHLQNCDLVGSIIIAITKCIVNQIWS